MKPIGFTRAATVLVCGLALGLLVAVIGCAAKNGGKAARVDYGSEKNTAIINSAKGDRLSASCPAGMMLIPSGPMLYGPNEEKDVPPTGKEDRINIKSFCIDKFEYPNEAGEAPTRSVPWLEARKLCGARGKRLCTEYEWEKACRGPAGTLYTYGDGYAAEVCPAASDEYGAGQFSNCVSGFGVQDMSGGVYEWTNSSTTGKGADMKILRGGLSKDYPALTSRCTYRVRYASVGSGREIGFRCCGEAIKEELSK